MGGLPPAIEPETKETEQARISKEMEQNEPVKYAKPDNVPKTEEKAVEVAINTEFDIDKFAKAVAKHETGDCTLGYGKQYNNCFGIKNGNTAPCKAIGNNRMCIYDSPEESYEAFKIIRQNTGYNGPLTYKKAVVWSGNDRPQEWFNNVTHFYNNL